MKLQYSIHGVQPDSTALTIGNLDGVHLGHQSLLTSLCKCANMQQLGTAALTFEPSPGEYFAKMQGKEPPLKLLTTDDKIRLLQQKGIATVIVLAFDHQLQNMPPDDFFYQIVIKVCRARLLVLGNDFRFGKDRKGDLSLLEQLCQKTDCQVQTVPLLPSDSQKISSSTIRCAIAENNLCACNRLLGYSYCISGTIVPGDGRGKTIGFATANMLPKLPIYLSGVFVSQLQLSDDRNIRGVTNIGTKPTFHGAEKVCETHLFDFDENLYNEPVTLSLHHKIRDEQKFDSIDQLVAQIRSDVSQAHNYFYGKKS